MCDNFSSIRAVVVKGRALGRQLGFPTANLDLPSGYDGGFGVFFASITIDGSTYYGVLSIGTRPTIANGLSANAEFYIFDFQGDIYGKCVEVLPLKFLREELKFDSIDALKAQIAVDVSRAKALRLV